MRIWYSVEWMVNESSGNESCSRKKKMVKSLKWVFKTLENWKKKLKEEIFALCLLNKSLKLKKEEKKQHRIQQRSCLPVKYLNCNTGLHQQHMIPTKCTRFISRHFLDMVHGRLNCHTVATFLIIAQRRLLFDKFREVSSLYRNFMVFFRKCVKFIWKFSMGAWKREWKNMRENQAKCVKLDRSARRFQDVFKTSCQDVFKTSAKTSSRHLQDVLHRCLQVVLNHQVKLFAWLKNLPRSHFWEIYG